jgi:hypothetical protein
MAIKMGTQGEEALIVHQLPPPFMPEDGSPDEIGDLRHDGVAEGAQTLHSVGYPMSHSTHVGFN